MGVDSPVEHEQLISPDRVSKFSSPRKCIPLAIVDGSYTPGHTPSAAAATREMARAQGCRGLAVWYGACRGVYATCNEITLDEGVHVEPQPVIPQSIWSSSSQSQRSRSSPRPISRNGPRYRHWCMTVTPARAPMLVSSIDRFRLDPHIAALRRDKKVIRNSKKASCSARPHLDDIVDARLNGKSMSRCRKVRSRKLDIGGSAK